MRKIALALTLTLLLALGTTTKVLSGSTSGSTAHDAGYGYAPQATDFVFPVGNPRGLPTYDQGNANGFYVTQMFNNSCDPSLGQGFYYGGQYFCGHTGIDVSNKREGDVVHAIANGVVVFAGYNSGYGEMIRIQHLMADGSYLYSQYEHLQYNSLLVTSGQVVSIGQNIALVGSTGFVTGPHLHFEIKSVNEDGTGYTFGNSALIVGYYEPLAFLASHMSYILPTSTPTPPASGTPGQQVAGYSNGILQGTPVVSATAIVPLAASATPVTSSAVVSSTFSGGQQAVLSNFNSRYSSYVNVTAEHLNVRAGEGYEYSAINAVEKGARLGYLGMSNGWVHVALPSNVTGYVARPWVDGAALPALPPVTMDQHLKPPFVRVLDARAPARTGPLLRDTAIEPLQVGEQLTYLQTSVSWDKVVLPSGRVGWVLNSYLDRSSIRDHVVVAGLPKSISIKAPDSLHTSLRKHIVPSVQPNSITDFPKAVVKVQAVNVRQAPRLSASIVTSLTKGSMLAVNGSHVSWTAVTTANGQHGYVLSSLVATSREAVATIGKIQATQRRSSHSTGLIGGRRLTIVAKAANLRSAPNLHAQVVGSAKRGTEFTACGTKAGWVCVQTGHGIAWVHQDLTK